MAVFIFDDNALDKMALVEGERWKKRQSDTDAPTFTSFKNTWYEFFQSAKDRGLAKSESEMKQALKVDHGIVDKYNNGAIYGDGGWTRYSVRASGEILFIKDASPSEEITRKAIAAGFNLF